MGIYDNIESDAIKCPDCNEILDDVQTKDGPKLLRTLMPGSIFKLPRSMRDDGYYNRSNTMIAYGRCPKCHYEWDINIPLIHVTGHAVVSPDIDTYVYSKSTWGRQPTDKDWKEAHLSTTQG